MILNLSTYSIYSCRRYDFTNMARKCAHKKRCQGMDQICCNDSLQNILQVLTFSMVPLPGCPPSPEPTPASGIGKSNVVGFHIIVFNGFGNVCLCVQLEIDIKPFDALTNFLALFYDVGRIFADRVQHAFSLILSLLYFLCCISIKLDR